MDSPGSGGPQVAFDAPGAWTTGRDGTESGMRSLPRHDRTDLLDSRLLHSGIVFDLFHEHVRLPTGLEQRIDVIAHSGAVCIAPVLDDGRLLCVRQYRHAVGEYLVEIPAGRLEPDETDPLAAARRELEEETGHRAREWELLADFFPAPGFCSERMVLYAARGLTEVPGGGLPMDDDEELELEKRSPSELIAAGCRDAKTLLACLLLTASPPA